MLMSISNSIRLTLNLEDKNITFSNNPVKEQKINGVVTLVYYGKLSPKAPFSCPKCGCLNQNYDIIKNGSKLVNIKLPRISNRKVILRLKKQRYLCKHCQKSFSAQSSCVDFNHSISKNTQRSCVLQMKDKISIKDIARLHDISHTTVNNYLKAIDTHFIVRKNHLPQHLSFDEFKSVKSCAAKMSFIFTDASNNKIVDIVYNRQLSHLKSYFFSYPKNVRDKVKTICIDMYAPYVSLVKSCFPNAKIILDRFHVIQLLTRSLTRTRIQAMNKHKDYYNKLKRYWRILLKDYNHLNHNDYRHYICFKYKMTEAQVLNELLRSDKQLEETYWFYQKLKIYFNSKNSALMIKTLKNPPENISKQMKTSLATLLKFEQELSNSLAYEYSNGGIEGTNNLIKTIKRIAFGYRSYENFRSRILLVANTMVRLEYK